MSLVDVQQNVEARAWRIVYASQAVAGKKPLTVIRSPRAALAYAEPIDPTAGLGNRVRPGAGGDDFTFVFVPAGQATPYEVQKEVEGWMSNRPGEAGGALEIQFRSERLIWRRHRAVCFGVPQALDEVFAAVGHFTFCERELSRLEQKVEETWPMVEDDSYLADDISAREVKSRTHVGTMMRTVTAMRIDYVRIQTVLESPAAELTGLSRRLFAELAVQANVVDRLRLLDDSVEVIQDFYRLAHERLLELRSYFSEVRGNTLIVIVLLVELLITIYGVFGTAIANYFK
jgi:hypothetical protein